MEGGHCLMKGSASDLVLGMVVVWGEGWWGLMDKSTLGGHFREVLLITVSSFLVPWPFVHKFPVPILPRAPVPSDLTPSFTVHGLGIYNVTLTLFNVSSSLLCYVSVTWCSNFHGCCCFVALVDNCNVQWINVWYYYCCCYYYYHHWNVRFCFFILIFKSHQLWVIFICNNYNFNVVSYKCHSCAYDKQLDTFRLPLNAQWLTV